MRSQRGDRRGAAGSSDVSRQPRHDLSLSGGPGQSPGLPKLGPSRLSDVSDVNDENPCLHWRPIDQCNLEKAMTKMSCLISSRQSPLPLHPTRRASSRHAEKGCVWQYLSDPALGLAAWVQHCDFGFRKINLVVKRSTVVQRYFNRDGSPYPGEPDAVIHVFDLHEGEAVDGAVQRIFAEHAQDKADASQCVVKRYSDKSAPSVVLRFTVVPNAAYQKVIDGTAIRRTWLSRMRTGARVRGGYFEASPARRARCCM